MILTTNLKKALQLYGIKVCADMIRILRQQNKVASGNLVNSIRSEIKKTPDGLTLIVKYPQYGVYVDKGRKPGKYPPPDPIKKWCTLKQIPQSAVFPIMKHIFQFGIPAVHFTDAFYDEADDLNDILGRAMTEDVTVELTAFFKQSKIT